MAPTLATWVVCHVCVLLSLLSMFSRVDAMVQTDQEVSGWKDGEVRLRCDFDDANPFAVFWGKVKDSDSDIIDNKARLFKGKMESRADRFSMNPDYSLSISRLRVSDEGRYYCQLETQGFVTHQNLTRLHIKALSSKPIIPLCNKKKPHDYHQHCTLTISLNDFNMECNASGFRPNDVTLVWSNSTKVLPPLGNPYQRTLSDGTYERVVTIPVNRKEDEDQNFTCTVHGEATNWERWSTSVTVPALPEFTESTKGLPAGGIHVAAIVIVVLISMLVVVILLALILRKFDKLPARGEAALNQIPCFRLEDARELERIRNQLQNYRLRMPAGSPGTSQMAAHVGLFGVMGVGKSSLINSLNFAFTGEFNPIQTTAGEKDHGGTTMLRNRQHFTEHISLYDNRGMPDLCVSHVNEILHQMRGERGLDPTVAIPQSVSEEIHCAVLVCNGREFDRPEGGNFLKVLLERLLAYNGCSPMIMITHKDSTTSVKTLREKLAKLRVTENIWFIENYTINNCTEDVNKSIKLLKFLQAALLQCEGSINNISRWDSPTLARARCMPSICLD